MRKLLPIVLVPFLVVSTVFGESSFIAKLRKKAEAGDVVSQVNLGIHYRNGRAVPRDYKEAVKWYRKAAEQGYATGQFNLGYAYQVGWGVPKDYVAAYAWYSLAAKKTAISDFVSNDAARQRAAIAKDMTPEQIAKAQELSKELLKKIEANKAKTDDSEAGEETSHSDGKEINRIIRKPFDKDGNPVKPFDKDGNPVKHPED